MGPALLTFSSGSTLLEAENPHLVFKKVQMLAGWSCGYFFLMMSNRMTPCMMTVIPMRKAQYGLEIVSKLKFLWLESVMLAGPG